MAEDYEIQLGRFFRGKKQIKELEHYLDERGIVLEMDGSIRPSKFNLPPTYPRFGEFPSPFGAILGNFWQGYTLHLFHYQENGILGDYCAIVKHYFNLKL